MAHSYSKRMTLKNLRPTLTARLALIKGGTCTHVAGPPMQGGWDSSWQQWKAQRRHIHVLQAWLQCPA